MDEENKELVEIVVGKMLEPVTDAVSTVFGIIGVDYLKEIRLRNRDAFARKTKKIFLDRNTKGAAPPPPSILLPLISAAENEGRDELLDIWARLMAAASDPARLGQFRRDYIEIAKQLEPIDAATLQIIRGMQGSYEPGRLSAIANKLSVSQDQVLVSFRKLISLGLTTSHPTNQYHPDLEALGRQFMSVLEP